MIDIFNNVTNMTIVSVYLFFFELNILKIRYHYFEFIQYFTAVYFC